MTPDPRRLQRDLRRLSVRGTAAVRRRPWATALVAVAAVLAIAGATSLILLRGNAPAPAGSTVAAPRFTVVEGWSLVELQQHVEAGEVTAITAAETTGASGQPTQTLLVRTKDGQVIPVDLSVTAGEAVAALTALGYGDLLTTEALEVSSPGRTDSSVNIMGIALPVALIVLTLVFVLRMSRRSGSGQRDGSTFRTIMPAAQRADGTLVPAVVDPLIVAVRLDDVAGCDEAKLELTETIEFLQVPERFHTLGARIPRGIMLYGPPGTGKTMLARAVATEAGVPFHHASGSDFVEKYVGVGARRVRDLFAQARKLGQGVIFIDEFDALGKARGGANSHEEREQTLNQLLVELDGFGTTERRRRHRRDQPARHPRRGGAPTGPLQPQGPRRPARRRRPPAILDVHARGKPLGARRRSRALARKTYGFSGAQLADLLNEAAIMAARRDGDDDRATTTSTPAG